VIELELSAEAKVRAPATEKDAANEQLILR